MLTAGYREKPLGIADPPRVVMAVPIRVLWYLRISLLEKIGIGGIFAVGIITMVTAIIRSVSLDSSTSGGQVSTTWLMLVCAASHRNTSI